MFQVIHDLIGPAGCYLLLGLAIALILWLAELWETKE